MRTRWRPEIARLAPARQEQMEEAQRSRSRSPPGCSDRARTLGGLESALCHCRLLFGCWIGGALHVGKKAGAALYNIHAPRARKGWGVAQ